MELSIPRIRFDLVVQMLLRLNGAPGCAPALIAAIAYERGCPAARLEELRRDLDYVRAAWAAEPNQVDPKREANISRLYKELRLRYANTRRPGGEPPPHRTLLEVPPLAETLEAIARVAAENCGIEVRKTPEVVVLEAREPAAREEIL